MGDPGPVGLQAEEEIRAEPFVFKEAAPSGWSTVGPDVLRPGLSTNRRGRCPTTMKRKFERYHLGGRRLGEFIPSGSAGLKSCCPTTGSPMCGSTSSRKGKEPSGFKTSAAAKFRSRSESSHPVSSRKSKKSSAGDPPDWRPVAEKFGGATIETDEWKSRFRKDSEIGAEAAEGAVREDLHPAGQFFLMKMQASGVSVPPDRQGRLR